jgi:hypothetical protein
VGKKQKGAKMSIHGKQIKKLLLTLLIMSSMLFGASVKLKLGGTEVVEGNALEVQIIAEGKDIKFPEIKDIGGFPVEGGGVSTKLESSYINGKFSSKTLKTLRFAFYPETDLTIPSFKVMVEGKAYQTKPIKISVVKPSAVTASSVDGYTLRIKSNKKRVYVGEPFIVTVDFFEPRNSSVTKVEYTPPKFKGFFSQSLGDEKLKRTATGTIHELQYLVSAKKEGKLTIVPPKARVGIRSFSGADRDPWGFFANDIKWHSVRAQGLTVKVEAVPTDVDLVGLFKIESSIDHTTVKPNTPVTYTIRISGEGNLDDLVDPKFDIPGVTIYGDDPKTQSKVVGDKVVSQYERKYVFISDRDFTIPSLSFKSFDYVSKKSKKLTTKSYKIKVDGNMVAATTKVVTTPSKDRASVVTVDQKNPKQGSSEANRSILEDTAYYKDREKKERIGYPLWAVLLAFLAGLISVLAAIKVRQWVTQRKGIVRRKRYSTKEALRILYPHTNHNKKVEAMVRKLYEIENGNSKVSVDKEELAKMIEQLTNKA